MKITRNLISPQKQQKPQSPKSWFHVYLWRRQVDIFQRFKFFPYSSASQFNRYDYSTINHELYGKKAPKLQDKHARFIRSSACTYWVSCSFYKSTLSQTLLYRKKRTCLTFATPMCCAIFPQKSSIKVENLETEVRERLYKKGYADSDYVYFNKGL